MSIYWLGFKRFFNKENYNLYCNHYLGYNEYHINIGAITIIVDVMI